MEEKKSSVLRDAAENIKLGLKAMWASFSPVVRAAIISGAVNFLLGFGFAAWVLP